MKTAPHLASFPWWVSQSSVVSCGAVGPVLYQCSSWVVAVDSDGLAVRLEFWGNPSSWTHPPRTHIQVCFSGHLRVGRLGQSLPVRRELFLRSLFLPLQAQSSSLGLRSRLTRNEMGPASSPALPSGGQWGAQRLHTPSGLSTPSHLCSGSERSCTCTFCVTVRWTQLLETSSTGFSPSAFLQTCYLHLGLAFHCANIFPPSGKGDSCD